jgi:two-component system cell cycle sensor histidine kinase/response regulator CckA
MSYDQIELLKRRLQREKSIRQQTEKIAEENSRELYLKGEELKNTLRSEEQAREKADEASEFTENLIDTVREPLIALDQDLRVVKVSRSFYDFFRVKPEETMGQLIYDLGNKQWDIPKLRELLETILPEKTTFDNYEVEHDFATIGRRTMLLNARQIERAMGKERIILLAIEDITERMRAEEEREKLQEEVLKARKLESLGTLAGGIAHDLNNLLFAVMGNISLAQDDLKPETGTSESLKEAEQACIKAKELTARLITFSKGGYPVKKMMSIKSLLKDTVISALSGSNIKPEISISDDIRQINIDEGQIKQVVRNIVVNAKEAMDDNGQLTVSYENVDIAEEGYLTLSQGEYIKISFKDHGCGISKENLEKIFDPYFSTKDMGADKGQGLGLTVSYCIVQKHGGLINVESKLETGSTFSIYLPALSIKEPDLQKSEEKPAAQKPVKQPATGTGKILLMDDEEAIRTFLGRVINKLGYAVETCTEGKEAIDIYKTAMESKEPFDVVILDLTNKIGMGGQETMKTLLELDRDVKGIVITGYSDDPVVANFRAYGFSGFITKPASMDELSKVINEVISKDL